MSYMSEAEVNARAMAEAWRPHRGALAVFTWHHRRQSMQKPAEQAPV